jgi:hypothetical protein
VEVEVMVSLLSGVVGGFLDKADAISKTLNGHTDRTRTRRCDCFHPDR